MKACFPVSVSNAKGPPVPIPNTEVKLCSGNNTCLETSRDDSSMLTQKALKVNTFKAFLEKFIDWDIAKLVKAQDFDSCISLVRVQLSQPTQRARASVPFVLAERCVPLARNEMCPSGVMFASQVMCASRVRSGTRHTTLRQRRNTSLWRSHNITAATPQHHFFFPTEPNHGQIRTATLEIFTNLCYNYVTPI